MKHNKHGILRKILHLLRPYWYYLALSLIFCHLQRCIDALCTSSGSATALT